MRTTTTLEDDLAVGLERYRAERSLLFEEALNETVRAGLAALQAAERSDPAEAMRTPSLPLGRRLVADVDDIADALATAEGEDYR